MIYGMVQFGSGAVADEYNLQRLLPIVYVLQAIIFGLIAMTGFIGGESTSAQLYIWFSVLGFVQCICFPAFVHIAANWFSLKNRGIAVGGFCTCINIGNILGA